MKTKEEILKDLPKNRKDWDKHYGYDNLEANLHGATLEVLIDIRDVLTSLYNTLNGSSLKEMNNQFPNNYGRSDG